jgi:succinate dehydrogenase cytochrome b subunit
MKVAFYPGCVSRGGCPELYPSAVKVAAELGLELEELTDVGCNGAGVLSREVSDPINARTLAKAEQRGLSTVMTICSTCTGVMGQASIRLREDTRYRERINRESLADEGLEYRGTVGVKHLLWILHEDYGVDRLKSAVKRPLRGLKVSPFYGCYIRRPEAIVEGKPQRKQYLERTIEAVGAEIVDFGGKGRCCGFPILSANETNSMAMVRRAHGRCEGARR